MKNIFSFSTIRAKLFGYLAISLLCMTIMVAVGLYELYALSKHQLVIPVQSAQTIAEAFYKKAQSGEMTEQEAKQHALEALRGMRYNNGADYVWVNDLTPRMVMHPIKPEMEGKDLRESTDPTGKKLFMDMVTTVQKSTTGSGYVHYMWPKKPDTPPIQKVSYVSLFQPWGWVMGTGLYVNDMVMFMLKQSILYFIIFGLAFVILLAVNRTLSNKIQHGVNALLSQFRAMANFDLTARSHATGNDEMAQAGRGLNQTLDELCHTFGVVKSAANTMAAASAEMSATSDSLHEISTEQSAEIQIISSSTDESAVVIRDINQRLNNAQQKVHMANVNSQEANTAMHNLQEMAKKVNNYSGVIATISEQINLLALNAAIEAARAGDAGRGFAVVADEVRKLAGSTSGSVQQIGEVMSKLVTDVEQTNNKLQLIVGDIANINDDITHIAVAMNEQSASVEAITGNMANFGTRVSQINNSIEESSIAARSVADESQRLNDIMLKFKI